jgi:hypothetical protein
MVKMKQALLGFGVGLVVGFVLGVGATLFWMLISP